MVASGQGVSTRARYLDRPVYVLASSRTFSGGEDFCYTNVAYRLALQHVLSTGVHPPIADEARDALAALPATDQG